MLNNTENGKMAAQTSFNLTGSALRDLGISRAVDHAEREAPGWSTRALEMLRRYVTEVGGEFMAEQVRSFAKEQGLPDPVHLRAWGGVVVKARNAGIICCVGTGQVENPNAHCANAAKWTGVIK